MAAGQALARGRALTWGILIALAGCAAGPNFRSPEPPAVDGYRKEPLPQSTAAATGPTGDAQHFVQGSSVPERWWTTFANAELERRIDQALAHSPTVASAQAALRQAREQVNAARGSLFPSVDAKAGVTRANANGLGVGTGAGISASSAFSSGITTATTATR